MNLCSYARIDRCGTAQPSKLRTKPRNQCFGERAHWQERALAGGSATSGRTGMRNVCLLNHRIHIKTIHLQFCSTGILVSSLHKPSRVADRGSEACSPQRFREPEDSDLIINFEGCEIYLTLLPVSLATRIRLFVYTTVAASVTSATPRAGPRIYRSSCSQSAR
jgi:hypothetical protein